jgi:hypothetical protein
MGIFLSYFVLECGGLAAAFEAEKAQWLRETPE